MTSARLLVVEEERSVGEKLREALLSLDYAVGDVLSSGDEALQRAEAERPDLVLVDINLQGEVDGVEAASRIQTGLDIPVVFLMGDCGAETRHRAYTARPFGYIPMPFHEQFLAATVETALDRYSLEKLLKENNRKQMKEVLRLSEKPYRGLVEEGGMAVLIDDIDGGFRYTNQAFADIFGYSMEEIRQQSIRLLVHPDDVVKVMGYHSARMEGREAPTRYEFRGVRKDGAVIILEVIAIVDEEDGRIRGTRSYIWDITGHKQVEKALRDSDARFRGVVQRSKDGIILTDEQGLIVDWNESMETIIGLGAEEVLGRYVFDVLNASGPPKVRKPEYYQEVDRQFREALKTGQSSLLNRLKEVDYRQPKGEDRKAQEMWFSVETGKGYVLGAIVRDITEHKQTEEALRISEAYYRTIVEDQPGIIYRYTPDCVITFANSACRDIFPMPPEEMIGQNLLELIEKLTPQNLERAKWQIARLTPEKPVASHEEESINLRGEAIWTHWTDRLLLDENGAPFEYQAIGIDISERKQTEEALRESEAHFRAIVEDQPGMLYRYSLDGTITFANDICREFFGKEPEVLVGQNLFEVIEQSGSETVEKARKQIAHLTPENLVRVHEHEMVNIRGEAFWFQWTDRLLLDEHGAPSEYQALGLDISERKRAEEALEQQRAFLRQVIDATPNAIFVRDREGCYVLVNKGAAEYFGVKFDELAARTIFDTDRSQEQVEGFLREDLKVMDTRQALFHPEEQITFPDGITRWLQVAKQPLIGSDGRSDQVLVVLVDITERKRLEDTVLESQKLAALGTLAAGMAHEINSPLQVITGTSESLLRRIDKNSLTLEELPASLKMVNRNAWRVAEIVRSLLVYARPSSEVVEANDLNALVNDTLLLMEHQLKTWSNITVVTELMPDLPTLRCEYEKIAQILINLLSNARDAMPDGGEVTIRTGYDEKAKQVILEVQDTGQGIEEKLRASIFDPFFTTKAVGKGTGLGLSIVRGIVKAHGGEINLESCIKQGTTFRIMLPEEPPSTAPPDDEADRYSKYQ